MLFPLFQLLTDSCTITILLSELEISQVFIAKSHEIVKMKERFWVFSKFSIESDSQP